MNPNDFLFREEYYDCISIIDDPRMRLAAWDILLKYGTKDIQEFTSPSLQEDEEACLQAVLHQLILDISTSKKRYRRARENGKKGGRPKKTRES